MPSPFVALFVSLIQIAGGGNFSVPAQASQVKAPASASSQKDKCALSGRVTNRQTGEPLKKATLNLMLRNNATNGAYANTGYTDTSEPDGSFKFEGIEPGEYSLFGQRSGYVQTQYGSKSGFVSGTVISLQPGQKLTDLKMQLIPQVTISGVVLDEEGDPVPGIAVEALARFWGPGKRAYIPLGQATTDDTGAYRISNLMPGKYYVAAKNAREQMMGMRETPAIPGKTDVRPVRTFYPSSLERSGASPVELKAGDGLRGIDIRMRSVETFHIRGKVAGDFGPSEGQPMMLLLTPHSEEGSPFEFVSGVVDKDHTFDIGRVTPGTYQLSLMNFDGAAQKFARQIVTVGSADLNDVVLSIQSTFKIHGSVELQGNTSANSKDKGLEGLEVTLGPADLSNGIFNTNAQATTKSDGTFALDNVAPGKMRVYVTNEPAGFYLTSIRFGHQETLGKILDLTQAAGGDLHVTLHSGAAEVSGTVKTRGDDAAATASTASILLIPEDLTLNGGSVHTTNTNQNGAFKEGGLSPGRYYVLAYEAEGYQDFDDPTLLKQLVGKGTKVDVKENDKQQVQLTLLAAEELQQALAASEVGNYQ